MFSFWKRDKRRYTEIQIASMLCLYAQGVSKETIAREYKCDPSLVMKIVAGDCYGDVAQEERKLAMKVASEKKIHRYFTPYIVNKIRKQRASGMLLKELADEYSCSLASISNVARGRTYKSVP